LTILAYPSGGLQSPANLQVTAPGWGFRHPQRWYTTKTEPSFEDMTVKLRRVIIAARFRPPAPYQASPEETRAVLLAWAAAET
jgi:hypothetical protein